MAESTAQGRKNEKIGQVVSTRMNKTIVIEVTRRVPHPRYKRVVTRKKKFYAHDEENSARLGDTVRVVESRPLSALKRWRLEEILRRAPQIDGAATSGVTEAVAPDTGQGPPASVRKGSGRQR
ncbi:MAG: 30S ribosomal protein S17 [Bryobacteraceae bacterium]|nr:30S ribosomal protein S17 [Bryobacteraceae bacterium]